MTKKVLLDTDIGGDIDDALCLAYLLNHPSCELLGVTTVGGEVEKRAMVADAICKSAEKKYPSMRVQTGSCYLAMCTLRQMGQYGYQIGGTIPASRHIARWGFYRRPLESIRMRFQF